MPKSLETLLREEVEKRQQKPPKTRNRTALVLLLAIAAISIVTSFLNYRTPDPAPITEPPADSIQI